MKSDGILYVEDNEFDAILIRHAFKAADIRHPLHVVRNGQQAIAYLSDAGRRDNGAEHLMPRLVLLDLHLPGLSGLEVLAWIRAQPALACLVVILFTSSQDPRHVAQAYELRVNSFVNKPTGLDKSLEFARLLKGWWLEHNQFPRMDGMNARPSVGALGAVPAFASV